MTDEWNSKEFRFNLKRAVVEFATADIGDLFEVERFLEWCHEKADVPYEQIQYSASDDGSTNPGNSR